MASISHEILTFFFFLSTLFSTSINRSLSENSPISCSSSVNCGNGLSIGYPFWPKNEESKFCGYPGFGLSCNDHSQEPILNLHKNLYRVNSFDKSQKTLTITYNEVDNTTICPVFTHDFTLTNSSILCPMNNKIVHFFYNCTLYPPSVSDIKCLQRGAKHSYAFIDGSVPEFDWEQYCENIVSVPVKEKALEGVAGNGHGDVMKLGFMLTWKPDNACQSCEDTGGFCAYVAIGDLNQTFFCLCNERYHAHNCHDNTGEAFKSKARFKLNYIVVGAVIGIVTALLSLIYMVQKKENILQKSGFTQIPRNNYEK